ncbi:hypothetical protein TNCV_4953401 [Trichonephila clavipes]|nr:hypothetical protein TNCV_4953401 [Trichonephila clavipes]
MPKRVVSFRPDTKKPLYVDRDCNSFGTHPYPRDCRRISSYCAIFAVSRSLVGRILFALSDLTTEEKKTLCTARTLPAVLQIPAVEDLSSRGVDTRVRSLWTPSAYMRPPPTALAVSTAPITPPIILACLDLRSLPSVLPFAGDKNSYPCPFTSVRATSTYCSLHLGTCPNQKGSYHGEPTTRRHISRNVPPPTSYRKFIPRTPIFTTLRPRFVTIPPRCANSKVTPSQSFDRDPELYDGLLLAQVQHPLQVKLHPKLEGFPTKIPCRPRQLNDGLFFATSPQRPAPTTSKTPKISYLVTSLLLRHNLEPAVFSQSSPQHPSENTH